MLADDHNMTTLLLLALLLCPAGAGYDELLSELYHFQRQVCLLFWWWKGQHRKSHTLLPVWLLGVCQLSSSHLDLGDRVTNHLHDDIPIVVLNPS